MIKLIIYINYVTPSIEWTLPRGVTMLYTASYVTQTPY